MLELSGLNVHYGKIHVLRDVALRVGAGEIVGTGRPERGRQDDDACAR